MQFAVVQVCLVTRNEDSVCCSDHGVSLSWGQDSYWSEQPTLCKSL